MFTQNDFRILKAITDKDDKTKGVTQLNGTTIAEIVEKTKLSRLKVSNTLKVFEKEGYIELAVKIKNSKTYIITEFGMKELMKAKGMEV